MTGTITATAGSVAGFSISGDSLVNKNVNARILLNNLSGQSFVRINESTASALIGIRTDVSNRTGLSVQTYASGATGIYVINNAGGSAAIKSYGSAILEARNGEYIHVKGLRVNVRTITSSTSINTNDDYIIFPILLRLQYQCQQQVLVVK